MKRLLVSLAAVAAASLVIAGCSSAAPASAPAATKAPAASGAAEPTKAAAPAATTAPAAPKVDFPQKGKSITMIVPFGAGGSSDALYRTVAAALEKELGVPVQVENKPGAGAQTGLTEFAKAKPDGYTIVGANLPGIITLYGNPDRQTTFTKKDFAPIGLVTVDPAAIAVKADSPYKTVKDLVDAAKANPSKIKAATTGLLSDDHMEILDLQRASGAKFAIVHFDSSSERDPALLGGKIDASFGNVGSFYPLAKAGQVRMIGVMDKQEYALAPGVPTLESQGYKTYGASARGLYAPGATPKEIVDVFGAALKKVTADPDFQKKLNDLGQPVRFMDSAQLAAYWNDTETSVKPLLDQAIKEK